MDQLPTLQGSDALFLDFDGTLVDLAERPERVRAHAELPALLALAHDRLDGALAVVSGRRIEDIDRFLAPFRSTAVGVHGLEQRLGAQGAIESHGGATPRGAIEALKVAVRQLPGVWVEDKTLSAAVHFRAAPQAAAACQRLVNEIAATHGLEVLSGKMVFELRHADIDKGDAVERLMRTAPFAGRRPLFIGDDVTDEDGFAVVLALGGIGIKVGQGATIATHRLDSVAAVQSWLTQGS